MSALARRARTSSAATARGSGRGISSNAREAADHAPRARASGLRQLNHPLPRSVSARRPRGPHATPGHRKRKI